VIGTARDAEKGRRAEDEIRRAVPTASVEMRRLDLADLGSVREFAGEVPGAHDGLDLLINNAGVMAPPRRRTADGFELQFGTNHLGHFALTNALLETMEGREDARVVTLSSTAHKMGRINFDNLNGDRHYFRWNAYGQSKLANLLFMLELDRRLRGSGSAVKSLAAHPGYAATNLQSAAAPMLDRLVMKVSTAVIAQNDEMGALPTLYAATQPGLEGGTYVGPGGFQEQRGHPKIVQPSGRARDPETASRLWEVSERLTAV
jgi:NAD(P)-dependent dehydrogenase (short-subunit alcohol dehydrogenase family)